VTKSDLEQQLLDSRQLLAAILQSSTDAIIVIDDGGAIQSFNAAAERMFGCSARDVAGICVDRLVPERFVAALRTDRERWRQTEPDGVRLGPLSVASGLAADGREFPCEARASTQSAGAGDNSWCSSATRRSRGRPSRHSDRIYLRERP
jgi:PAS domain S-box-containing protein